MRYSIYVSCLTNNTSASRPMKKNSDLLPATVRTIRCGINGLAGMTCSCSVDVWYPVLSPSSSFSSKGENLSNKNPDDSKTEKTSTETKIWKCLVFLLEYTFFVFQSTWTEHTHLDDWIKTGEWAPLPGLVKEAWLYPKYPHIHVQNHADGPEIQDLFPAFFSLELNLHCLSRYP